MFGICFVQFLAAFKQENEQGGHVDGQLEEMLDDAWGSVLQAMYTLFKVSTGGVSWGEVSDPMFHMGWQMLGMFLIYMAFFMFVMTNVVTAIFVSSAEEYASKDEHAMMLDQLQAKQKYVQQVIPLYLEMDRDNNGEVTKAEFQKYISDPRMAAFATNLDIDTMDLHQFFHVLSGGGEMPVDLDAFVDGCIRLRGTARSLDVYDLKIRQNSLAQEIGCICSLLRSLLEQQTLRAQAQGVASNR